VGEALPPNKYMMQILKGKGLFLSALVYSLFLLLFKGFFLLNPIHSVRLSLVSLDNALSNFDSNLLMYKLIVLVV
jgi:hypothetical protein